MTAIASSEREMVLSLRGVTKSFGAQRALDSVDLEIRRGEIHAVVGQNGCGKSTLVKLLGGYHGPDAGSEATVAGERFELGSAAAANDAGLRFVHQDLGLIEDLSVAENFFIASHRGWVNRISKSDERSRAGHSAGQGDHRSRSLRLKLQSKCEMGDNEEVFIRNRQNVSIGFLLCVK